MSPPRWNLCPAAPSRSNKLFQLIAVIDPETAIEELRQRNNLRELRTTECSGAYIRAVDPLLGGPAREYYNLSSNDYLGFSDPELQNNFLAEVDLDTFLLSNPSSRLMTGNSSHYEALEQTLRDLFPAAEDALVLGSGYMVNSGVLAATCDRDELIISDKLIHASLIDGLRLCSAEWQRYRHNDMEHLERLLRQADGRYRRVTVATESIFSMDGDKAPLLDLATLQQRYDFDLYIDEAHAFGVVGPTGCGLVEQYNATATVPLRADYIVATLGKALASQGAFVICSRKVRELLVNRMRTLIFSTALPPISLMWSRHLLETLPRPETEARRERLRTLVQIVEQTMSLGVGTTSHIIPLHAGDNGRALEMAATLREAGFWTTAIRHPTVPDGTARLRISLSAAHTPYKIEQFATLCKRFG